MKKWVLQKEPTRHNKITVSINLRRLRSKSTLILDPKTKKGYLLLLTLSLNQLYESLCI